MRMLLILSTMLLAGCSTMMCLGTGTCVDGAGSYNPTVRGGAFTASTVILPSGTYVIVPNYSTGQIQSVIQTSRGK